jgi:hypothetical protein
MHEPAPPLLRLAPRNGAGVAALAFGAVALALVATVVLFPVGGVLGMLAMLLAAVGIGRVARWRAFNRGQAVAGLLLGALAVLLAVVLVARLGGSLSERAGHLARLDRCLFAAGSGRAAASCAAEFAAQVGSGHGVD